ncbi:MAG TPA: PucR family transcriptional regulator ligand-binding domain-containing protein [Baekduia sp.]|nr:PucR family transcriptional regulator ligand-binding domain-containing protein [Baekduia sp.]
MDAAPDLPLLLGDLLDDATLGLELIVGRDDARLRTVDGANSVEGLEPARWLDRGWVVLTTGSLLAGDEESQRRLIAELDESGVTALGFGIGVSCTDVPQALLEEARRRAFPLFTVPLATPFRDVMGVVQRGMTSSDARAFGRLAAAQRYLVAALGQPDPQRCILDRLAQLTDAHVAVLDRRGGVIAGRCPLDLGERLASVRRASHHTERVESEHGSGWLLAVGDHELPGAPWLIVIPLAGKVEHVLLKSAAQIAVPLLEATAVLDEVRRGESKAVRRATLDALIDAGGEQEAGMAAARAASWGIDFASGVRVAVVQIRARSPLASDGLIDEVETRMGAVHEPWLATFRGTEVAVLVPAAMSEERLAELLCDTHPTAFVGLGRAITQAAGMRASHLDAVLTVGQLVRGAPGRIASYEDLDLGTALVGEIPAERIQDKVDQWLTPVLQNPMAYETLVTYLENDLDVGRTSRALALHPNSTRYRLARVEDLLGAPLRRASTIAALHFALLAKRYNDAGETPAAAPVQALHAA